MPRQAHGPALQSVQLDAGTLIGGAQLWFQRETGQFFVRQDGGPAEVPTTEEVATLAVGFFLHQGRQGLTLIDTGIGHHGSALRPLAEGVTPMEALAAQDWAADDVDHVVLTHLHIDHAGGVLEPDGSLAFPRARHVIHAEEVNHWTAADASGADEARRALAALEASSLIDVFEGDSTEVGDVRAVHTPGHTPGHTSVELLDGGQQTVAFVLGDIVHHAMQFGDPGIGVGADVDPGLAARTRRATLNRVADTGLPVGAGHLADACLLRLDSDGKGGYASTTVGHSLSGGS